MHTSAPLSVLIRPAEARDAAVVYRFLCELEDQQLDLTAFQTVFERNLGQSDIYYRVAEAGGEVIGFMSCHVQHLLHHVGKVGEIQELFVRDDYRNQRIGRQFMDALDTLARQQNFVNLEVTTNRIRTDTHRFYEQAGFRATHYKFVKTCTPTP